MKSESAVELAQVVKRFASQPAVDGVDLAVPRGSIFGFIGPNGSGKTTTMRLILRIYQPDEGRVVVLGSSIGKAADPRVGYLPEERGLYRRMTVRQVLRYFARLKGIRKPNRLVDEQQLTKYGIDPELVARANANISLEPMAPYTEGDDGEAESKDGADILVSMFLPFGIMMLMFMVIFMAAQPMLESGMEEKQHRIAELLLGAVSPAQLMTGKLLGNVAGSFVIFAIYRLGGILIAQQNQWEASLGWSQLPWLIIFHKASLLKSDSAGSLRKMFQRLRAAE